MSFLLSLLIVAAQAAAPIETRHPDAAEIFHCGFEEQSDRNIDAWPDGWTRTRGPKFPAYLPIKIVATDAPQGSYALRIGLNGGAAAVYSPKIEIDSIFSYVLEGSIKTEGLKADGAYLSLTMFDAAGNELERFQSRHYNNAADWTKVRLGPLTSTSEKARAAILGVHLEPGEHGADLRGSALFDDIWLARLPRMSLHTNRPDNVYTDGSQIDIRCDVSGIVELNPMMQCELLDVEGKRLGEPVTERLRRKTNPPTPGADSILAIPLEPPEKGFAGSMHWKPAIKEPGFYRARIALEGNEGKLLERQLTLVVIEQRPRATRGDFGWALPRGNKPLNYATLAQLIPQMGNQWAKYPVWLAEKDAHGLDRLIDFAERLNAQGIESVGLLVEPPPEVRQQFGDGISLNAAAIFSTEPEIWYRPLEPITTRLSLQVHWWQLGTDHDTSFVGDQDLAPRVAGVKKELEQFGQVARVGVAWPILTALPQQACDFFSLTSEPSPTTEELAHYLPPLVDQPASRWVSLEPLARDACSTNDRAADLVRRMISAKQHGASAIFIPDPFDPEKGLMNEDGTPGELLLPWRTTALALDGAHYVGSIAFCEGSQNHVFSREGEIVIAVWNPQRVEERIFLGDDLRQVDVWGKSTTPRHVMNDQVIEVGPVPTFLVGVSEPIVRWNMAFAFGRTQLPSIFGTNHENSVRIKNFFPQGTSGQIRMHTPDVWQTTPRVINFKLAAGEESSLPFTIRLPFDATNGRYPVRVDFEIAADRVYHFSAYRSLEIGTGNVSVEMTSHLTPQGDLEVVQYVTNNTEELISFKCSLYAPDRRRLVSQITRLGPQRDTKRYRFPNGKSLIGKTILLRADEIGGVRTYNYRFVAKE